MVRGDNAFANINSFACNVVPLLVYSPSRALCAEFGGKYAKDARLFIGHVPNARPEAKDSEHELCMLALRNFSVELRDRLHERHWLVNIII